MTVLVGIGGLVVGLVAGAVATLRYVAGPDWLSSHWPLSQEEGDELYAEFFRMIPRDDESNEWMNASLGSRDD